MCYALGMDWLVEVCIMADIAWVRVQDKAVIVIGGGDTGTDCIGTSVRHGAKQVCHSLFTLSL